MTEYQDEPPSDRGPAFHGTSYEGPSSEGSHWPEQHPRQQHPRQQHPPEDQPPPQPQQEWQHQQHQQWPQPDQPWQQPQQQWPQQPQPGSWPPAGSPPGYPGGYQSFPGGPGYPGGFGTKLNRFSGWALGLGLAAIILPIGPLLGVIAVISGIVGLNALGKDPYQRGRWQATTGIVCGCVFALGGVLFWVGAAIPDYLSTSQTEAQVRVFVNSHHPDSPVASVSCPSNIPKKTGHVFYCTVRLKDGTSGQVKGNEVGHDTILYSPAGSGGGSSGS